MPCFLSFLFFLIAVRKTRVWLWLLIFLSLHLKKHILIVQQLEEGEYKLSALNGLTILFFSLPLLKKDTLYSTSEGDFPTTISTPAIVKC